MQRTQPPPKSQLSKTSLRLHNNVLTSGNDFYDDGYNETELETEVPNTLFANRGGSNGETDSDGINGFFGRENELRQLHRTFDQMMRHSKPNKPTRTTKATAQSSSLDNTSALGSSTDAPSSQSFVPAAFVWGTSGTGKSKLVDIFCNQLLDPGRNTSKAKGVRVLKGKFQEHQKGNPFSAITQALSDWCKHLTCSHVQLAPIKEASTDARTEATTDDSITTDVDAGASADKHRCRHVTSQPSELQRLRSIVESSSLTMQQKEVLVALVPALSIIFSEDGSCDASVTSSMVQQAQAPQISSTETSWNRFQYTFTQFLSLISSKNHPVVMVLDDLQWASQECMDLMSTTMHQPHFLWIGTIRQDTNPHSPNELMEFNGDLPLMQVLNELQQQCTESPSNPAKTPYIDIHLQDFSKQELHEWVSQLFDQDDDVVDEVAELFHKQTEGNIFHTIQLLQDMERTKALTYSRITFQWELDSSLLSSNQSDQNNSGGGDGNDAMGGSSHAAANNVIQLISSKLRSLPAPLQKALILASYIRSSFELDTLQAVWDYEKQNNPTGSDILPTPPPPPPPPHGSTSTTDNGPGKTNEAKTDRPLAEWLEQAVLEGLLANSIGGASYRFAHDRIQQAARNLVPFGEVRTKLRLRIGQCLWDLCTRSAEANIAGDRGSDSSVFFIAADHLNCTPTKDHLAATRRNLQVGEYALQIAALVPAATYLQLASTALRKVRGDPWQDHYDLMIRLVRARCDIELTLNRFDLGYSLGNEVLDHARSIHDKLPTYGAMANALGKQNEHTKGLQLAQQGAQMCGDHPKRWFVLHAVPQLLSTQAYLKKTTTEEFLYQNPITTNPQTLMSMNLLRQITIRAFSIGDMLSWILATMRMIQITRRCGSSEYSAFALSGFAIVLASMGDFENARKLSELAKDVIHRVGSGTKAEGWIYYTAVMIVDPYFKPLDQLRQDFQHAYKSAMAVGDIELSVLVQNSNITSFFFGGRPLTEVIPAVSSLLEHIKVYKTDARRDTVNELTNTVQYMRGTLQLDWEASMDFGTYDYPDLHDRSLAYWCRLHIAVYFGKLDHAEKMDHLLMTNGADDESFDRFTSVAVLNGIVASHRYRQSKKRKYLKILRQRKRQLKYICDNRGKCALHRYLILRAESKAIKVGSTKPALVESCYDDAINQARQGDHLHEAGLACELAGKQILRSGNQEDPRLRSYFTEALCFYERWGAIPKCKMFREAYGDYIDEDRVRETKIQSSLANQVKSLAFSQGRHGQASTNHDLMSEGTQSHAPAHSVSDVASMGKAGDSRTVKSSKDGKMGSKGDMEHVVNDGCLILTDIRTDQ